MTKYLQCWISAEDKKQVDTILNSLLAKKLVAGGLIVNAPARFGWKGETIDMNYYNISVFTTDKHRGKIIEDVRKTSVEEVPMIWFVEFDGNEELLQWIDQTVAQ